MTGAVTAGGSTLFDDTEAFDRALAAALTGRGGLCVVSEPTGGRSALLSRAIAALPGLGVAVVQLGAAAEPREIEAAARPRAAAPANRRLILVEEAHLLSVAALRTLNGLAAGPQLVAGGAGLLLSGTPDLLQRLLLVRAERLLHFPAFTLDPANDAALPAGRPTEPRRQGGGIDRLSQAAMAVAALVIAGSVAVFVMAPSDAGRRTGGRSAPDRHGGAAGSRSSRHAAGSYPYSGPGAATGRADTGADPACRVARRDARRAGAAAGGA